MQFGLFDQRPVYFASFQALLDALYGLKDDPLAFTGHKMVVYRGNPKARLMIVGEAPGAREDELGKPFVGRSGQLMDQILRAAGFDPAQDVYIGNVVKRRPPENRDPTQEELDYYAPYLFEEIRLIDPLIIVCTGRFSMRVILDEKQGITRVRGTWYPWNGRWVMPIYHPAYLLRNPSRSPGSPKAQMWDDIREIRRKYTQLVGGGG